MAKKKEKKVVKTHSHLKIPRWWLYGATILLVVIVFLLNSNSDSLSLGSFFRKPSPTLTPTPASTLDLIPPGAFDLSEKEYTDKAIEDLAKRLNIKSSDIKVASIEKREWGNTSLGCPEKDRFYAEVITPGYLIKLSAKGKIYNYHAGLKHIVLCGNG